MGIYPPKPASAGKAYMMPSGAAVQVISGGGGSGGSSGTVTITSPTTTGTAGVTLSLAGTVSPSGTAVNVGLSSSATVAPGSFTSATVSGTGWTASLTPASAGTWYIWAESGSATPAISPAVTVGAGQTALAFSLISTGATGGVTAVAPNNAVEVNFGTPLAHGSSVTPDVTLAVGAGSTVSAAIFWWDTSPTNQSSTAGTASGLATAAGIVGGYAPAYNATTAPATAGTYYAKTQITVTGTNAGTYVFSSQAITVS